MDYKSILKQINNNQLSSIYLLDGEEPYYIDLVLNAFENKVIPEEERDFNLITMYGRETTWREVISTLRGFPMFGDKLLVVLKEAAQMKDLNELIAYIEQPMPSTIFVIEHRFKKLDSRGKLKKAIDSKGSHFYSEKIKETQLPEWVMNYCADNKVTIAMKEAETIGAYLGNDLQKIANEINKILINEPVSRTINAQLIEKYIGISREYNAFELPDILFEGNTEKLSRILNYFEANPNSAPMPVVLGSFYTLFRGMYLSYGTKENFQEDRKLGIWGKHRKFARIYPEQKVHRFIAVLEEFSHKTVGVDNTNKDKTLLREMTGKLKFLMETN